MMGPGFAAAAAGEFLRQAMPAIIGVVLVLVGIGLGIGWLVFA
jgi:hypothetical protein